MNRCYIWATFRSPFGQVSQQLAGRIRKSVIYLSAHLQSVLSEERSCFCLFLTTRAIPLALASHNSSHT
jgi:hypothetical protein